MHRLQVLAGCCAIALSLCPAPGALAQDDAPQVDPDSPAGTEYELPLDRAREQASGRKSRGGDAPLFGEGVAADSTASSRDGSGGRSADTGNDPRDLSEPTVVEVPAQASAPDGNGGSLLAIGAGAAGVLLLGGISGLGWRRRSTGR